MTMRSLVAWLGLIGLVCAMTGCARLEFSQSPVIPEVKVQSKTDSVEHPSPPPLASEKRSEETPPAPAQVEPPGGALNLTVEGAIVMALEHNQGLIVQQIDPAVKQTFVSAQRSAFDPVLVGGYTRTEDRVTSDLLVQTQLSGTTSGSGSTTLPGIPVPSQVGSKTKTDAGSVGVTEHLPTGADVSLTFGPSRTTTRNWATDPSLDSGSDTDVNASGLQFAVTQKLLRGMGLGVNLASLRQAKLDVLKSEYQLRGFVENLVSQVEQTYWDCLLAQRQISIFEESLKVAQTQADEVEERIRLGRLPETERAAAASEVAQRRSSLIDARSNLTKLQLALLRLLNPSDDALRYSEIHLNTEPVMPEIRLSQIEDSIKLAQRMRPDVNQARLQLKRDDLEIVKTKNGLLPQLDLFINMGKNLNRTEYADSFMVSSRDVRDSHYSTQVGAQFSYPIGNRAARALHAGADLTRQADREALLNMAQLVEQDVRTAYVEVGRSQEQIAATAATRRLQEQTLDAEIEKFRIGRSTTLLVAQAQRDLLSARINEVQAQAAYLKAIVNLYRLEGSLLERRGVICLGREPVALEEAPSAAPVR